MLRISDQTFDAMDRDNDRRKARLVAGALRDACPERFVGMDLSNVRDHTQRWIDYIDPFGVLLLKNVTALYVLWNQWGSFDDRESEWIVEILRGPLQEDEKIASLYELLF